MDKMKKALQAAHHLAAKSHPLSHYKEVLQSYQEDLIEQEKARAAEEATSMALNDDGEDVEMEDAPTGLETPAKSKKAKKRKAEDSVEVSWRSRQPVDCARRLT